MSIWASHPRAMPPGTPDFRVVLSDVDPLEYLVCVESDVLYSALTYLECHRWCCNKWGLTSTEMLPVRAAYEADLAERGLMDDDPEAEEKPKANRFRKQGT